jgi:hypothetical protein
MRNIPQRDTVSVGDSVYPVWAAVAPDPIDRSMWQQDYDRTKVPPSSRP